MSLVKFDVTRKQNDLISLILVRAVKMAAQAGHPIQDELSLRMDLMACHANGCPINFEKLLTFDDFSFSHDVFGISRNMNRKTGELMNCFLPRCYDVEKEAA